MGHDASDGGLTGKETCEQFRETIEKSVKKFKPHRVAACKITPVKNGFFFGRDQNNKHSIPSYAKDRMRENKNQPIRFH